MAAKKKAAPKSAGRRPGIGGKGNKAPAPVQMSVVDAPADDLEAAMIAKEVAELEANPPEAPKPPKPPKSKSELKRRKALGDKSVAALQAESFDPAAIKAAFEGTAPIVDSAFQIAGLSAPLQEVHAVVVKLLTELQEISKLPAKTDKAPLWLDHLDQLGDGFDEKALKAKAFSLIKTMAENLGKDLNEQLTLSMELAELTGKENPGVAFGSLRAKHQAGETVTKDADGMALWLVERGLVNPQLASDALEANTKRTPFAYTAFYSIVDQRAVNLAAHRAAGFTEDEE